MPSMQNIVGIGKLDDKVQYKFARSSYCKFGGSGDSYTAVSQNGFSVRTLSLYKSQTCIENNGPRPAPPGQ